MKILAAGDIHGDRGLARELSKRADAEEVDAVVLCGDLVDDEMDVEGFIGEFKKPVFLVPGNHDSEATVDFLAERYYHAKNLHGYGYKFGNIGFVGCSSVNLGLWQMPEKDIFDMIKKANEYVEDCETKILVSHVHPDESKMGTLAGFAGSKGLRKAIDELKPHIVLCSHIHEAEGIEELIGNTKVINVGRKGKILEI
jgi:uncharacterized protein